MLEYLLKPIYALIKYISKKIIRRLCFTGKTKVIIAGTGRCASALFTKCIARSYLSSLRLPLPKSFEKYLAPLLIEYVEDLREIRFTTAPVIKTHDLYLAESFPQNTKSIFIYGDPLISAISVALQREILGEAWVVQHIRHLHGSGQVSELFSKDVLNYENQIISWSKSPSLKLHYPTYWNQQDSISEYLGFDLCLPPYHDRDACSGIVESLKSKYNIDLSLFKHLHGCERKMTASTLKLKFKE